MFWIKLRHMVTKSSRPFYLYWVDNNSV